jgi:tetratricopeptide (TPR) repeat protein
MFIGSFSFIVSSRWAPQASDGFLGLVHPLSLKFKHFSSRHYYISSDAASFNTLLGAVLYWAHRFEQAIEQLKKVIELDPAYPLAHIWVGLSYAELLLGDDALPHIQRALELSDRHPRMLAWQGYVQAVRYRSSSW